MIIKTTKTDKNLFQNHLISWQKKQGRHDLPWQKDHHLYATWLSEIMLQQTQVKTVIPYYKRFMSAFPTIQSLADASLDDVLSLWSGLGYYARGRNLHAAACWIRDHHKSEFPTDFDTVLNLSGIGRSTAGAILSLTDNQPYPILDGNVRRVYCRYFLVKGWVGKAQIQQQLWQLAEQLLPKTQAGQYNQALMDLGAMVCTHRKMQCQKCPLESGCKANKKGLQAEFPEKKVAKKIPTKKTKMLLLMNQQGHLFLTKNPPTGVWGGLWCFPRLTEQQNIEEWLAKQYKKVQLIEKLEQREHVFSHFRLEIEPIVFKVSIPINKVCEAEEVWYDLDNPVTLGLAKPVTTLLNEMKGKYQ